MDILTDLPAHSPRDVPHTILLQVWIIKFIIYSLTPTWLYWFCFCVVCIVIWKVKTSKYVSEL